MDLYAKACGGSGSAKVPLLEMGDGSIIVESLDISRAICRDSVLYPPDDARLVDEFVHLWCDTIEGAYYDILRASTESQARFAVAGLISALSQLEDRLWQQRMQRR